MQATDERGQMVSVLFDTAPAYLTAKQMAELVAWTNQALATGRHDPLAVVGAFVVESSEAQHSGPNLHHTNGAAPLG